MVAVVELFLSALFGTILTVPTMLILYHKVIIPRILAGVKTDLPPAILAIVDAKVEEVKNMLEERIDSMRQSIIGKKGNDGRMLTYALRYLDRKGVTEDTLDVIAEKYGSDILQMIQSAAIKKSGSSSGTPEDPFGRIAD